MYRHNLRSVVLCAEVGLHALSVGGTALEDVLAGFVAADEGDGLDCGLVEDEVDGVGGAMDDVQNSVGKTGLSSELGDDHGSTGTVQLAIVSPICSCSWEYTLSQTAS